ncbi:hypothetical protein OQA88_4689 [Cercophora sp. LCS_1]
MVETDDFNNLLKTGSWRTSRSRSPGHDRLSQSSRSYGLDEPNDRYPRSYGLPRRVKGPPAPSVEDEIESLAREHTPSIAPSSSDDEPMHRGEIDQQPILLPVAENNEERRFVIMTNADPNSGERRDSTNHPRDHSPENAEYEGNTCRQYVLVTSDEDPKDPKDAPKETRLPRKKSHQDLPRLDTAVADEYEETPPIRRSNSRRNREKAVVDQPSRGSARSSEETFSSPVVTQTAGGRDRAYLDLSSAPVRPSGMRGPREEPRKAKEDSRRSAHTSSSPSVRRRLSSTAGARPPRDALGAYGYGNPEDVFTFMNPASELPPPRGGRLSQSPTKSRKSTSPPYPGSSRDRLPDRPAGQRSRRESNAREQGEYYGSDVLKSSRSDRSERPGSRRPGLDTDSLLPPELPPRAGPKGPSPIPSPRVAQGGQFPDAPYLSGPRSPRSTTLPYPLDNRRTADEYDNPSSTPPWDDNARGSRPRAPSRSSSIPNGILMPVPVNTTRANTSERRTPATVREESQVSDSPKEQWQPAPFDPEHHRSYIEGPIISYRRYSEDVEHGVLPRLPECRWALPRPNTDGKSFFTIPRAENFVICYECYDHVFADKSEFTQAFIEASVRPEQQIVCSFGSSFWYRVAFLMILKYRHPDLRLLENVAHIMSNLPELTVCDECYDDVVWPLVENSRSEVPGHFIRGKQTLAAASCQLYSTRMRDVFQLACRDDDMGYLERKVREKLASEADLREKKTALLEQDQNNPKVQKEMAELERMLREIE